MISVIKARVMMGVLAAVMVLGIAGIVIGISGNMKSTSANATKAKNNETILYSSTEDIEDEMATPTPTWLPIGEVVNAFEVESLTASLLENKGEDDSFMNVVYEEPEPEEEEYYEEEEEEEYYEEEVYEEEEEYEPEPTPEPTPVPQAPSNSNDIVANVDDEALLTCLIYTESGDGPYQEMMWCGSVVLNRAAAKGFSIYEVIVEKNQFSVYDGGQLARALQKYTSGECTYDDAHRAAVELLAGGPVNNYISFLMYYDGLENELPKGELVGTTWFHNW